MDEVLAHGIARIPSVSPHPLEMLPSRQVEIEHAYELGICGIGNANGVVGEIRRWLSLNFVDPLTSAPLLAGSRYPSNDSDMLVIWMRDWTSTAMVLNAHRAFMEHLQPEVPRILPPRLLYSINKMGVSRNPSVTDVFQKGANSVAATITALTSQFTEFRHEQLAHNNATGHQLAALQSNQSATTEHLKQLTTAFSNQTHALFALGQDQETRSLLSSTQLRLSSERAALRYCSSPEEKGELLAEIARLKQEEKDLLSTISGSGGRMASLLGGSAASVVGRPQITPADPTMPPGLQRSPSARLRERASRPPTPSLEAVHKRPRTDPDETEIEHQLTMPQEPIVGFSMVF
ncbi:hypothetical protein B0H15DRAFT_806619 [Mycena belliarum]|uniref:Uncharacterized protein n=1 Tax=Mycena belliarum TaxID=1033014 RepID=A0AAD6TNI7_9AGAR|nr:hypothetical protein B0H15DRAFT_806619 [Mycena belliae]